MNISIATYRALSVLTVALLVAVIALATAGKSIEAATGFALMLAVILQRFSFE